MAILSHTMNQRVSRSWVAYELTADEANGTIGRSGKNFRPDDKVKVVQADNYDYRGSGWSRGHMAPAGDFNGMTGQCGTHSFTLIAARRMRN